MKAAVLALCGLLAACASADRAPDGPPLPEPGADSCGATPYGRLIGQPSTALERELILRQVRLVRPGTPQTADLRPERLNFQIDLQERIVRLFCG